jgi:RNA polymerase sigma-70 factor (ECF subfamily)
LLLADAVVPAAAVVPGWSRFVAGLLRDERRLHSLPVTGAELVARFRAGDESAIRDLYREYGRVVFAIARRALGDRSLAEEAVQQTFLQAWRAAGSFDPSRDLAPWIYTIARRVCIDLHRRESRRQAEPLDHVVDRDPALISQPGGIEESWQRWQVRSAIDQLPVEEREVVRLQHLQGFTHQEIADRTGVPLGTVKSRSHRAHRRLAALLGHLEEVPA